MSLSTAAVADAVNAYSIARTQDGLNNDPGHCSHVADSHHDRDIRKLLPEKAQLPIFRPERAAPFLSPAPHPNVIVISNPNPSPLTSNEHSARSLTHRDTMRLIDHQTPQFLLSHYDLDAFQEFRAEQGLRGDVQEPGVRMSGSEILLNLVSASREQERNNDISPRCLEKAGETTRSQI